MKPILEVQHISKQFKIGGQQQAYLSLRDVISNPFLLLKKHLKRTQKDKMFMALSDVSFNVFPGESIGIIGRNGAGKSTLLKILSKITPPTSGKIICRGRVASLLEVGTGFHPELTGRENIYMNGSILGMRRREIDKNFDAIVDFSGVEVFLDTPLKKYSSGMQLRLAFAVAAHLEPEILVIDEVLAVGDAEFQKKCMGKMDEVSKSGRTIIFVSHNMSAIRSLCKKGILLNQGKIELIGEVDKVIDKYLSIFTNKLIYSESSIFYPNGKDILLLKEAAILSNAEVIYLEDSINIKITFIAKKNTDLKFALEFFTVEEVLAFRSVTQFMFVTAGNREIICQVPKNLLNAITYKLKLLIVDLYGVLVTAPDILILEINEKERMTSWFGKWQGTVRPLLEWKLKESLQ